MWSEANQTSKLHAPGVQVSNFIAGGITGFKLTFPTTWLLIDGGEKFESSSLEKFSIPAPFAATIILKNL